MEIWIKELLKTTKRNKADVLFSEHASKDKNLDLCDIDNAITTIRKGKVAVEKSTQTKARICFKMYFKNQNITYFVVTELISDYIKIITIIKKKGKF